MIICSVGIWKNIDRVCKVYRTKMHVQTNDTDNGYWKEMVMENFAFLFHVSLFEN